MARNYLETIASFSAMSKEKNIAIKIDAIDHNNPSEVMHIITYKTLY